MLFLWNDILDRAEQAQRSPAPNLEALIGFPHVATRAGSAIMVAAGDSLSRLVVRLSRGYGSIDVRTGVPAGLLYIDEPRLQPVARRLGIPYATALVGFTEYLRNRWRAKLEGIVIEEMDAKRFQLELAARDHRRTANHPHREARQKTRTDTFFQGILERFPGIGKDLALFIARRACAIGSRRIGTRTGIEDPFTPAVGAYVLHELTDYHKVLDEVHEEYRTDLREWRNYLDPPVVVARRKVESEVQLWLAAWREGKERPF